MKAILGKVVFSATAPTAAIINHVCTNPEAMGRAMVMKALEGTGDRDRGTGAGDSIPWDSAMEGSRFTWDRIVRAKSARGGSRGSHI